MYKYFNPNPEGNLEVGFHVKKNEGALVSVPFLFQTEVLFFISCRFSNNYKIELKIFPGGDF